MLKIFFTVHFLFWVLCVTYFGLVIGVTGDWWWMDALGMTTKQKNLLFAVSVFESFTGLILHIGAYYVCVIRPYGERGTVIKAR
jgi:hypothetical protein